ncbi:MAG: hypothetical protein ACK4RK_16350 [Gemmataceae bacterium]
MGQQLVSVRCENLSLNPTEAHIRIDTLVQVLGKNAELRGRLLGPRCRYASTVEVAYPMRPYPGHPYTTLRVIIPEPNLWEPATPFLYQGPLELWQNGEMIEMVRITHGLRTIRLGPAGLRLNGWPFTIIGSSMTHLQPDLAQLRETGVNTLLSTYVETDSIWKEADELGFLVIARMTPANRLYFHLRMQHLPPHPSCLGWLLEQECVEQGQVSDILNWASPELLEGRDPNIRLGIELERVPVVPLPAWASFLACTKKLLPLVEWIPLPKLILLDEGELPEVSKAPPGILGWVAR